MSADRTHAPDVTVGQPTATPAGPLPTVPGYQLIRELGRGGIGNVYEAKQEGLGRTVALKLVPGNDPKALTRLHAHADAVAAVCHPNVVQIYDYAEHEGQAVLTLEFVPGGSLVERLQDIGRMTGRPAASLVAGIARGLAACHAQQLVHGELKPGNILLDETGEPKISDVGFARCVQGTDGSVMGQPVYVAPELVSGATRFVGPGVDVWSLGVILYECITGRRPFQSENASELIQAICHTTPERPTQIVPELQRDLEHVCLKCLAKNPTHRYHSATEVADDLNRFLAGEAVHARVPVPAERLVRWARRNKLVASVAAGTLILTLAGFVGSVFMWQRTERQLLEADAARLAEQLRSEEATQNSTQAERTRNAEQKRAEAAVAGQERADRTILEFAGSTADLIGLLFAQNPQLPPDADTKALLGSLDLCRRVAASSLMTPQLQVRFSTAFVQVGEMLENKGDLAEASELYREALVMVRPIAAANPKERTSVSQLSSALAHQAAILKQLGQPADAVPFVQEALKLDQLGMLSAEGEERRFWKGNLSQRWETLASVYRAMGKRSESKLALEEAKGFAQDANQLRLVAGEFALLAASVPSPPSAEEAKEKEQYLTDAIETLRAAVVGGWRFPSARTTRPSLIDNADFRPFKDHPEVKKLLAEAAKK